MRVHDHISSHKGFTLTELVVVVSIMAIALLGMLQFFIFSSDFYDYSENLAYAMANAESKLEEMRNYAPDSLFGPYTSSCVCSNGTDDDSDSNTDYPQDTECQSLFDTDEGNASSTIAGSCTITYAVAKPSGTGTITVTKVDSSDAGDLFQIDISISWQNKNGRSVTAAITGQKARR